MKQYVPIMWGEEYDKKAPHIHCRHPFLNCEWGVEGGGGREGWRILQIFKEVRGWSFLKIGRNKFKIEEWISFGELTKIKCLQGLCENELQRFFPCGASNNRFVACSDIGSF